MSTYINPPAALIENPKGLDKAIQAIQQSFISRLPWLAVCYGKATTGYTTKDGREYKYPEVYIGEGRYQVLEPNNYVSSHAFFKPEGPQEVTERRPFGQSRFAIRLSIIFWLNLDTINAERNYDYKHRFTEELRIQIMEALNRNTDFVLTRVYESAADVFAGYSFDHLANQTFKHPEAGFKFEGVLNYREDC